MTYIKLKHPPKKILVVSTPAIGDAFFSTPLVKTLKNAFPDATIDMLVRRGSDGLIQNNPDINEIILFQKKPTLRDHIVLTKKLFRKYDIAFSTSQSDRAFSNALIASRINLSIILPKELKNLWKYFAATFAVTRNEVEHIIVQNLRLSDALELPRHYTPVVPLSPLSAERIHTLLPFNKETTKFVVVHTMPSLDYKVWPVEKWSDIISYLDTSGFKIVVTGAPTARDQEGVLALLKNTSVSVTDLTAKLSFSDVSELISSASLFVGVDTCTTHLASVIGIPTVAIHGPTNLAKWGLWPAHYHSAVPPFVEQAGIQKTHNAVVVCGSCKCLPYDRRCKVRDDALSECLFELSSEKVIEAIEIALS